MKPFSAEWDGFHCLQHSLIRIFVRPLAPAFLIPSIPVPFRRMYADSHGHNRRAPQLVRFPPPPLRPQQQCALSPRSGK